MQFGSYEEFNSFRNKNKQLKCFLRLERKMKLNERFLETISIQNMIELGKNEEMFKSKS
jgi:hypothetical protein